jgi:hypothetical protein
MLATLAVTQQLLRGRPQPPTHEPQERVLSAHRAQVPGLAMGEYVIQ